MFKIRIILMSVLLLLMVGVNLNVRAHVNTSKSKDKAAEKEQSDKESKEHESKETITGIDFFGAFSLVNIQLQWRDLHIGLDNERIESELSVNTKELPIREIKTFSTDLNYQVVPVSILGSNGEAVLPVGAYRTYSGKTYFSCSENKQLIQTIAYILHCSAHPAWS